MFVLQIALPHLIVRFQLQIMDGDDGYQGKHNMLMLLEHCIFPLSTGYQITRDDINITDLLQTTPTNSTEISLPRNCDFRFYRHWPMSGQQKEMHSKT